MSKLGGHDNSAVTSVVRERKKVSCFTVLKFILAILVDAKRVEHGKCDTTKASK